MKSNRGFTLIEIMISGGIMMIAVLATCMMLLEGQRFTRNTEEVAKSNDSARLAGELIVGALRTAGMGANLGVFVNNGGVPRLISPIFGTDNIATLGFTDDIWMIMPERISLVKSETCQTITIAGLTKSGGSAALVQGGTGQLQVNCTLGLLPGGIAPPPMLLVTNFQTPGVLLTQPSLGAASDGTTTVGQIDYSEEGLGTYPPKPFLVGDLVYGASVVRFFVKRDANGRPGLYRQTGLLTGASPPAFVTSTLTESLVQEDIEDLQFSYGVDPSGLNLPNNYTFTDGFPDGFTRPLRSVRVNVISIHERRMVNGDTSDLAAYAPIRIENHDVSGAPKDPFRRSLYSRRVELVNLSPGAL
ncbi:MAG TPA: PilW family protein [Myxococcaceae bacterium]|nr:PilW family protein [Myxococcaceae bacterium]